MADPRLIQQTLILGPGVGVSQLPRAASDNLYVSVQTLLTTKLDRLVFPLGGTAASGSANLGDVLTWDGSAWINRNWVAGPFGVGLAPVSGVTFTVSGAVLLFGPVYSPGLLTVGPVTANSLTVTGATRLLGATNAGSLVADTAQLSTLTVTGTVFVRGSSLLGDLTAGGLTASTLTVTGASTLQGALMASGRVTLAGDLTTWGTNTLYGPINTSGAITATLIDSTNTTVLFPLKLQRLLTPGLSGSTDGVGIDFWATDFGGNAHQFGTIFSFQNSGNPFGTAISFNNYAAGASQELLRLRNTQAWFPKDLQCEGSASFNGSLLAGPTTTSTLLVTGTTQILGATLVGDLTAGNLVASTLTVTGTTMASGAVTLAGNLTGWGTNTLYGPTNASGVITATLVDSSNSSALYPLVLEHRLTPNLSGSTQAVGVDMYSIDGTGLRARYCFIKTFMNNAASFGTALSFNTFSAGVATENLRLRDTQAWFPKDLQAEGSVSFNGRLLAGPTTLSSLTVTGGVTVQGGVTVSGGITAIGRVRSLGIYTPVLAPAVAWTPTVTGADTGCELEVPFHPKDGTTTLNFASRRISWRCSASGSTSGTITLQKSPAATTGAFDPTTTIGTLTLLPGAYQAVTTTGLASLVSGDHVRVFVNLLPAATNWTILLALESTDAPP